MLPLIDLTDGDNHFCVRVRGRSMPGVLEHHDRLDAELLLTSSFVTGRLPMWLRPSDLRAWSDCLNLLARGQDAVWRDDDRSPAITVLPHYEEYASPAVRVEDPGRSDALVILPLGLEDGWVEGQRGLLERVLERWPSEVRETGPGVYEWGR
ncbi:DUF5959 family protein [Streptomyces griseosporeus]|uniref:DUF5959 family protein n=1 Tax=Streptomyces griseosporeus TaxID=1910 RepID=UPI00167D0732|nr:DUF5959 family protein [Streptomyces griseosporeus]GHF67368.1 hypothetical protein GCM10018783_40810 [Streptomyces griseosporeus]